jgi:Co/Zn/Cd efflux system component
MEVMSGSCCHNPISHPGRAFRRVLWIALAINAAMFVAEFVAGFAAQSVSLGADALDFLADSANYAISLFVVGRALHQRAKAALAKGVTMIALGVWIMGAAFWNASQKTIPEAMTMGLVGFAALAANAIVLLLLWAYRSGDSNMQSIWLCSRNDVIGNCAVLFAALGVFGTDTGWPDIIVASIMGALATQGALRIVSRARAELREANV